MPKTESKTIALIATILFAVIALVTAGYGVIDSSAKIDSTLKAHDDSAQAHMHVRNAVTAVSEATGAIQDSVISMGHQLRRIEEIVQELRDK